jgi:hypothetical protein
MLVARKKNFENYCSVLIKRRKDWGATPEKIKNLNFDKNLKIKFSSKYILPTQHTLTHTTYFASFIQKSK